MYDWLHMDGGVVMLGSGRHLALNSKSSKNSECFAASLRNNQLLQGVPYRALDQWCKEYLRHMSEMLGRDLIEVQITINFKYTQILIHFY